MSEKTQKLILLTVGVLALSLAIGYLAFGWTEPPASPPTCPSTEPACNTPINVSTTTQTKRGGLNIATQMGKVGIATTTPTFTLDVNGTIGTPYIHQPKSGDIDKDGFVNSRDFTYVIMSYGCGNVMPCWNERIGADTLANTLYKKDADLNNDGEVEVRDIFMVARNYESFYYLTAVGYGGFPAAQFKGVDSSSNYFTLQVVNSNYDPLLYIRNDGNVGIGTTTPAYKLDVNGALRLIPTSAPTAAKGVMYFDSTANKFKCSEDGTSWKDCIGAGAGVNYWTQSGSNLYPNDTAWNVGIGTTTPSSKLDVVGNIEIDSWDSQLWQGYAGGGYMRRSIGGAHGWDSNMLYINGWNDWSSGVSIGGPGGTSNLSVTGKITLKSPTSGDWGAQSCKEYVTSAANTLVDVKPCEGHNCHISLISYCTIISPAGWNAELVFGDFWQSASRDPSQPPWVNVYPWRLMYIGELASVKGAIGTNGDTDYKQMMYTFPSSCIGDYCELADDYPGVDTSKDNIVLRSVAPSGSTNTCFLTLCSEGGNLP